MSREIAYITVSELSTVLNKHLERQFPEVFFTGEIAELTLARSGHLYLTIKDEFGQLSAVMWAGMAGQLDFKVEQGLSVLCHGRPNIYRVNGRFQIVLHRMLPAGEGALRKKFLELQQKLEKEGLFAIERKRKLPFLPKAVGIVTSGTGAVIHDIMVRIQERMPHLPTYLVDVKVQGPGAAQDIASALRYLDSSGLVDVIILARGGGSLEDLWAFNEEVVVRAIFACRTPVVSGVGHEVDVSLSDFVADVRAPTPTAAAEMVVPKTQDLLRELEQYERRLLDTERWLMPLMQQVDELDARLQQTIRTQLDSLLLRVSALAARVQSLEPREMLAQLLSRVNLAQERLLNVIGNSLLEKAHILDIFERKLDPAQPLAAISRSGERVESYAQRLQRAATVIVHRQAAQLDSLGQRLESLNPRSVLKRGFALVQRKGSIVMSASAIEAQDDLQLDFSDGRVNVHVVSK